MPITDLIDQAYDAAQSDIFYAYEEFEENPEDNSYKSEIDNLNAALEGLKKWADDHRKKCAGCGFCQDLSKM